MIPLKKYDLNPRIVFASYYHGFAKTDSNQLEERYIYDYEIELIIDVDNGYMLQNNKHLELQKGDIIFRKPGEKTHGFNHYNSYVICFEAIPSNRNFGTSYQLENTKSFQQLYSHEMIDQLPELFHTYHIERYLTSFKQLFKTYITDNFGAASYTKALLLDILFHLNQEISQVVDHRHKKSHLIKSILNYIDSHIASDLSLNTLAEIADLSPIYFHQIFKTITGYTLTNYVIHKRIESAKELLINSEEPIKTICILTGFNDPSYFGYVFKKHTNITPMLFRETHRIQNTTFDHVPLG